jgi:ABC-2 type transport system ATP-binding protein
VSIGGDAVIAIDALSKTYRAGIRWKRVHAVKNLTLRVPHGSIVAFVGPNGAGKTTTIHTLLGLLKPDTGTVRIFGEPPGPSVLRRVGYQSEVFHTYPFYSTVEALRYYGRLSGLTKDDLARSLPPILERLGLKDVSKRPVGTFSKGMTQRLGLAQALLHEPALLILDEPTSGLDPEGRRLVLDIIREEKQRGRTVFLSSHILSDVERTCDEVVMINKGEVAFADRLSSFAADEQQWEIEVDGWTPAIRDLLAGHQFIVAAEDEGSATLVCAATDRKALLHALTALPVEVGAVNPRRGATLEDKYLEHVINA